ncbi:MAG: hypothetical protein M1827_003346 [Pycnora praestabilis]|nr:MAG: hypothetical protein M1827_003346 [Pycnora praestabilis]
MSFRQEATSWLFPRALDTAPAPTIGARAPSTDKLTMPNADGKPTIIAFLRHCGCPFAEKTFLNLRSTAEAHPHTQFVAVSHSDSDATNKWLAGVGEASPVQIIIDPDRELYARWGLGLSSTWHMLSPWSLWSVIKLGREEGIWNRPTESGTRWQTAGAFGIDSKGIVKWGKAADTANDLPDFQEAIKKVDD